MEKTPCISLFRTSLYATNEISTTDLVKKIALSFTSVVIYLFHNIDMQQIIKTEHGTIHRKISGVAVTLTLPSPESPVVRNSQHLPS